MSAFSWFRQLFGGNHSANGYGRQNPGPDGYGSESARPVTGDTALQISTAFACVRLLSETVGSLPLHVFDNSGINKVQSLGNLADVLRYRPNPLMDSQVFRETMMINLVMHGNAYARKGKNARGEVVSLWPLAAPQMTVKLERAGVLRYVYREDTKETTYGAEDILHIRLPGSGLVGWSPISYARNSLGLAMASEDLAARYFRKGGKATGTLEMPNWLTDAQRSQVNAEGGLVSKISGADSMGTVVLEGGIRYNPIQFNPADLQMLESRKFSIEDVARWFGVPLVMIGHTEKTTSWGTGVEQIMLGFYKTTLRPYLERWELALTTQLLTPQQRRNLLIEFDFHSLLRGDAKGQAEYLAILAQNGFITRNEGRQDLGRAGLAGGDELTIQVNMTPAELLGAKNA